MKFKFTSMLCLIMVLFFSTQAIQAQNSYDLQFAPDCDSPAGQFCVNLQIKASNAGESFAIGSHTVFFEYNIASIGNPTYTPLLFDNLNTCFPGLPFGPYNEPQFSSDAATGEGNMTTNMQIPNFGCPDVTDEWITMGFFCFDVVSAAATTDLAFNTTQTLFNLNSNVPQHIQGNLIPLDIVPVVSALPECSTGGACTQMITTTISDSQDFCDSANPDLGAAEATLACDGDCSVFTIAWFFDAGFGTAYDGSEIAYTGNGCTVQTTTLFAQATCSDDGSTSAAGSLTVNIYPEVQAPTITRDDDVCTYTVTAACANDVLTPSTFGPTAPGDAAGTTTINVASGLAGSPCAAADFSVAYEECPAASTCDAEAGNPVYASLEVCEGESTDPVAVIPPADASFPSAGEIAYTFVFTDPLLTMVDPANPTPDGEVIGASADGSIDFTGRAIGAELCMYGIIYDNTTLQNFLTANAGTLGLLGILPGATLGEVIEAILAEPIGLIPPVDVPGVVSLLDGLCAGDLPVPISCPDGPLCLDVTTKTCFTVVECVECTQTITAPIEAEGDFCETGTPNLATAEAFGLGCSGDCSEFTIEWFMDDAYTMPYGGGAFTHSGTDLCAAETFILYAQATCVDGTTSDAGTFTVNLFPAAQEPSITRDDATCAYTVVAACPNDIVDPATFTAAPGDPAGTIDITVIPDGACNPDIFTVSYDACPAAPCSQTITADIDASEDICEAGTPDLAAAEATLVCSGDCSVFAIAWFTDDDYTMAYDGSALAHSGADLCAAESVTLYAQATCSDNGDVIGVGTLTVNLYPAAQAPTITRDDEACNYTVTAACPGDVLSPATFGPTAPGDAAGVTTINVTSALGVCPAEDFDVAYEACPVCSDAIVTPIAATEDVCEVGTPDLAVAEATLGCDGDCSAFAIEWFMDAAYTMPYGGGAFAHSGADLCAAESVTLYAQATCADDGSETAAGTLTVNLYPAPQAPTTVRDNDNCDYTVIPACPGDMTLPSTFTQFPGAVGTINIIVTSGIAGNSCAPEAYNVEYDECPPDEIPGCTDATAINFDPLANVDDGSCEYEIFGCTDPASPNFDPLATVDDGSCGDCSLEVNLTDDGEHPFLPLNYYSLEVLDGSGSYSYEFDLDGYFKYANNGEGGLSILASQSAFFTITIIDNITGCITVITDGALTSDLAPLLNIVNKSVTPASGFLNADGAIDITVAGGGTVIGGVHTPPDYSYEWYNASGMLIATSQDLFGIRYGWYTVVVTDATSGQVVECKIWVPVARGKNGEGLEKAMLDAHPNPFSHQTTIGFVTTETEQVSVNVFSIEGKLVHTLFNEVAQANESYTIQFNSDNLASGMYLVKLITASGEVQTHKLMLAK